MYVNQEIGKYGEEVAEKYLKKNNYNIIEKNFSCKKGEIDIICFDKKIKELVFVEVKTRCNTIYGKPAEAVHNIKQKHIYKTAEYYLIIKNKEKENVRIDVIEVYIKSEKKYKLNHIKKAIMDKRY